MRTLRKALLVASVLAVTAAGAACGDDDDNVVRTRPDGGPEGGEGGAADFLSCGIPIPPTYDSPNFAVNAKAELDFKASVLAIVAKMQSADGTMPMAVTTTELNGLFTKGVPSLRSVATAFTQTTVDTYISQFGDAQGKTWKPADAEAEGGAPTGGKYDNGSIFSATGLNFREATEKLLFNGSLYNYALVLSTGPITEATVDRFVALFGSSTKFANRTDATAGVDVDGLIAEYASKRDNKLPQTAGPYRTIARALRAMKAAAANQDKCKPDLDAALKLYFLEWERTSFLTVIYYLNQSATNASASPPQGEPALRGYAEALGFITSFRGIPQDRRKITDVQIDSVVTKIGGATPYQLITRTSERIVSFNSVFSDIGAIYGLTQTEIEDAKKVY